MRVAVTTIAPGLDAEIEPRFWHAAYLTIVDGSSSMARSLAATKPVGLDFCTG